MTEWHLEYHLITISLYEVGIDLHVVMWASKIGRLTGFLFHVVLCFLDFVFEKRIELFTFRSFLNTTVGCFWDGAVEKI
jgi:hypothetical protein